MALVMLESWAVGLQVWCVSDVGFRVLTRSYCLQSEVQTLRVVHYRLHDVFPCMYNSGWVMCCGSSVES